MDTVMDGLTVMKDLRALLVLLKETYRDWSEDKASRLAAALAYYTAFSVAPLLLITIAVAGLVFGREAAQGQIFAQLQGLLGADGAERHRDRHRESRQDRRRCPLGDHRPRDADLERVEPVRPAPGVAEHDLGGRARPERGDRRRR